jgi:hypothetical protein
MSDRERMEPSEGTDAGAEGGAERHDALGPGDGTRTGGSAGTASGHDPMGDEVQRQQQRDAERRAAARANAEGGDAEGGDAEGGDAGGSPRTKGDGGGPA